MIITTLFTLRQFYINSTKYSTGKVNSSLQQIRWKGFIGEECKFDKLINTSFLTFQLIACISDTKGISCFVVKIIYFFPTAACEISQRILHLSKKKSYKLLN